MKAFYALTTRGRALRLRRMALAALESYDLDVKHVRLLTNDFNGIFRLDTTGGEKYILRVCLPEGGHSLEEIRSEMMWLAALRRDTGLGVPRPVARHDGAWVTTVEVAGVPEARHCVVFSWMPGPDLADRRTPENVYKLGALAAQLHDHAASFRPSAGFWLKTRDKVFPFGEPLVLFDDKYRPLFPPDRRRLFEAAVERVQEALDQRYGSDERPRVIHNDLHQWNVKVYRGKVYALDFEDLMWGYPVQDIAVSLYYFQGYDEYEEMRWAFRQGYESRRAWPERVPGEIDIHIAGRGLELANFILQDPHPEWRKEAPAFVERTEARLRSLLVLG